MALDHQQILLLVNVITITAFTSLTLIWYIRKWDREALAKRIIAQRASTKAHELSVIEQASVMEQDSVPEHVEKVPAAARVALPAMKPEMSQLTARRADGWMAPSVAQWSQRLSSHTLSSLNQGGFSNEEGPNEGTSQKEPSHSPLIVFPRHEPGAPAIQRLAGPLALCNTMPAAKYGRSSR